MAVCELYDEITVDKIIAAYQNLGYKLFTAGDYNVNLFGIRCHDRVANTFNDMVGLLYKVDSEWVLKKYDATTDPGVYYREHPMNSAGTAIIAPGQYSGAFKLGYHKGQYEALVQNNPIDLYRDNNKDDVLDFDSIPTAEIAGINLHRANANVTSTLVDKISAGCAAIADPNDFKELLSICKQAAAQYGSTFTFTLFTEAQVLG